MRKILVLVCLFLLVNSLQAQTSEVRTIGSFKGISAAHGIDVYLKKGTKESVRVEVTGIPIAEVVTEISGATLKIHMQESRKNFSRDLKNSVKVYVTYVSIGKVLASAAANIFSDGPIKSANLEISAYSAGSVEVSVDATSTTVESASGGDVTIEGKSSSLSADASSGGDIDAYKLESENVTVSASSGGEAKVSVSKSLVANAVSGGDVRYRGNPSKTMSNANSGGTVKKTN